MNLRIVSDGATTIVQDADTGNILRGAQVVRIENRGGKLRAHIAVDDVVLDVRAKRRKARRWDPTRLRLAMVEHNLTLAQIGREVGVTESCVWRWAAGAAAPKPAYAQRLDDYLRDLNSKAVVA